MSVHRGQYARQATKRQRATAYPDSQGGEWRGVRQTTDGRTNRPTACTREQVSGAQTADCRSVDFANDLWPICESLVMRAMFGCWGVSCACQLSHLARRAVTGVPVFDLWTSWAICRHSNTHVHELQKTQLFLIYCIFYGFSRRFNHIVTTRIGLSSLPAWFSERFQLMWNCLVHAIWIWIVVVFEAVSEFDLIFNLLSLRLHFIPLLLHSLQIFWILLHILIYYFSIVCDFIQ